MKETIVVLDTSSEAEEDDRFPYREYELPTSLPPEDEHRLYWGLLQALETFIKAAREDEDARWLFRRTLRILVSARKALSESTAHLFRLEIEADVWLQAIARIEMRTVTSAPQRVRDMIPFACLEAARSAKELLSEIQALPEIAIAEIGPIRIIGEAADVKTLVREIDYTVLSHVRSMVGDTQAELGHENGYKEGKDDDNREVIRRGDTVIVLADSNDPELDGVSADGEEGEVYEGDTDSAVSAT